MGNLPFLQGGVALTKVVEDPTLGERIYRPGHPDADENGYIRMSNVNPMVEMADEPHLHFEMTVGGVPVDPLDYISASAQAAAFSEADEAWEG